MRIAVPFKDGNIDQHFGKCEEMKIYEVVDKKVVETEVISSVEPEFLKAIGITTIIAGGMGPSKIEKIEGLGIDLYVGAFGEADKAVEDFLAGTLQYADNTACF
ncbi:MAG: dinitrogenase iron-molybdenum cofactor biosynthesis protein [Clostridia bacterium]|nr:dinitrogenase iron-molybdenum cofactor biosynthesis protein [Clostridia bacterium]